ncbi:MAG TPA: N-acetyl-gamma-glutamyl-phosphate reductase [Polyangiaceae bacterium]|nr:N-acetyl-gamma-glutamyl-phosphate reductase [Polyangiaceae bacterium]
MNQVLRVGILGAGGYTGAELVRLVHQHPRLSLVMVGAREKAGKRLSEVLPGAHGVAGLSELVLEAFEPEQAPELARRLDVAFLCLPHAASARAGKALYAAGVQVVDLSADFRLKDATVYQKTYGDHPATELLSKAVYGQPELHRAELTGARLIAAPGCHVTTALLPLAPLLEQQLIETAPIIIDSKTGVSGGGRSPAAAFHFPEASEGTRPYKVGSTHRHVPEIEQELSLVAGQPIKVCFTPVLVPMSRGILATAYARPKPGVTAETCRAAASALYQGGLVSVLPEGTLPDTLWVRGSARAHVAYVLDEHAELLLAMCTLDNLARGASAQAIQAFNVSQGWPDALGLPELPLFP